MSHILIVEDERHLADGLRFNLELDGYTVTVLDRGEPALEWLATNPSGADLVVLDVMLPGIDGFTVAAELRKAGIYVPILMLTALSESESRIQGLEAGADDILNHGDHFEVLCPIPAYDAVSKALQEKGLKPESSELAYVASIPVPLGDAAVAKQVLALIDALEALDDVKAVHGNHEIDEKLLGG